MYEQVKEKRKSLVKTIYENHENISYLLEGVDQQEFDNILTIVYNNIDRNEVGKEGKALLKWLMGMEASNALQYLIKYEGNFILWTQIIV